VSKEIKVGLLVVVTLVVAIFGYQFLRRSSFSGNVYYAIYDDVSGLYTTDPIFVSGYRVGKVGEIQMLPNSNGKIVVELILDDNIQIPANSTAKLGSDLLGEASITLDFEKSEGFYTPGDTIKSFKDPGMIGETMEKVEPLFNDLSKVLSKLDTTLLKINSLFPEEGDEEAQASLYETVNLVNGQLTSLTETTDRVNAFLGRNTKNLTAILDDVSEVTGEMADNSESVGNMLADLETITGKVADSDIETTVEELNGTLSQLETLLNAVNNGDGTVAKLVNDPVTYQKLEAILNSMDALLVDFKANPSRYVSISLIERKNK
jgi:phospholipid/cholesterol/gamma-HCH transport system substrate-binding protein